MGGRISLFFFNEERQKPASPFVALYDLTELRHGTPQKKSGTGGKNKDPGKAFVSACFFAFLPFFSDLILLL